MDQQIRKISECLWLSELNQKAGIPASLIWKMLKKWQGVEQMRADNPKNLQDFVVGPPERINRMKAFLHNRRDPSCFEEPAAAAWQNGIRAVNLLDDEYPSRLKQISGSPLVLYYRGERYAEIMDSTYFVTLIGTRSPTAYGRIVAARIASDIARRKVVVISGLARGIDTLAHRAALDAGGMTIAVVGNGPDLTYPPENKEIMNEIALRGLIISEHPPGTPPLRQFFPARNRILSGLADAVAVIEASRKSGTMITASFAGDQGKDVFAVPGSILSPFSSGCNQLIREGAEVLTEASDILWRLPIGHFLANLDEAVRQVTDTNPQGQEDAQNTGSGLILHALKGCALTMDELASKVDLLLPETAAALTRLEMCGLIHCERGRYSLTRTALYSI